jgi:hypothetical protein
LLSFIMSLILSCLAVYHALDLLDQVRPIAPGCVRRCPTNGHKTHGCRDWTLQEVSTRAVSCKQLLRYDVAMPPARAVATNRCPEAVLSSTDTFCSLQIRHVTI